MLPEKQTKSCIETQQISIEVHCIRLCQTVTLSVLLLSPFFDKALGHFKKKMYLWI